MSGASIAAAGTTLVHLSPLGLIRHDPVNDQAYEHLGAEQAVAFDTTTQDARCSGRGKARWGRDGS